MNKSEKGKRHDGTKATEKIRNVDSLTNLKDLKEAGEAYMKAFSPEEKDNVLKAKDRKKEEGEHTENQTRTDCSGAKDNSRDKKDHSVFQVIDKNYERFNGASTIPLTWTQKNEVDIRLEAATTLLLCLEQNASLSFEDTCVGSIMTVLRNLIDEAKSILDGEIPGHKAGIRQLIMSS